MMMTMTHCHGCREFHKFIMLKKHFVLRDGRTSTTAMFLRNTFNVEWNIRPFRSDKCDMSFSRKAHLEAQRKTRFHLS